MLSLILVLLLSAFICGCSDSTPPEISHEMTLGKHEASLCEEVTTYADLSLNGKTLTMKGKKGITHWLFNSKIGVIKEEDHVTVVHHHGSVDLKLRTHPSGYLIFTYQMSHHFGRESNLDTGTMVIPKSFVDVQ